MNAAKPPREMVWYRGRQWFIAEATIGAKNEFKANEELKKRGFETIFPTKPDYWFLKLQQGRSRKFRRRKPRDHEGEVAILGKAIFVGALPGQAVRTIRETRFIQDVMETASGQVYRVPAPSMEQIARWLDGDELNAQPEQPQAPRKGEVYFLNEQANQIHMAGMLFEIARDCDSADVGEKIKGFIRFMGGRVEASVPSDMIGERVEMSRNAKSRNDRDSKQNRSARNSR